MGLQLPNSRPVRAIGQIPVENALSQPDSNPEPWLEQVVAFLFANQQQLQVSRGVAEEIRFKAPRLRASAPPSKNEILFIASKQQCFLLFFGLTGIPGLGHVVR